MSYYNEYQCEIRNMKAFKKACDELGFTFDEKQKGDRLHFKGSYIHVLMKNNDGSFRISWESDERKCKAKDVIQRYAVVDTEMKLHAAGIKTQRVEEKGQMVVKAFGGPMGPNEYISITVEGEGKLKVDAKGFQNNSCKDVQKIIDKLGHKKTEEVLKPEAHIAAPAQKNAQGQQG